MDEIERREVHHVIKYCHRKTKIVVDQAMQLGRVNKTALNRHGLSKTDIERILTNLRLKLKDYDINGQD